MRFKDLNEDLNELNEIKNVEIIKYKKHNLFKNLSDIILPDKTLESESQENENEKIEGRKEENENEDEDKDDYENEYDDETISQNEKSEIIKGLNDSSDEIIDKSKLFKNQIELLKKLEDLKGYCPYKDFGDKELKFKYFKTQLADMSNEIDKSCLDKYLVIHL